MDKLGVIIDFRPIRIHLSNRSVDSLKEFAQTLAKTLKPASVDESKKEPSKEPTTAWLGLDFICIEPIRIQVFSKSDTNLSLVNYIPDIELEFSVCLSHPRRSTSKTRC